MMKYNKNDEKNKNSFLVACVCSILLLLTLCYFGINSGAKGTSAASTTNYYCNGDNEVLSGTVCVRTDDRGYVDDKSQAPSNCTLSGYTGSCYVDENPIAGGQLAGKYGYTCQCQKEARPVDDSCATIQTSVTYTVTYDANGGTGAPTEQKKTHGVAINLSNTIPTRDGYIFVKWNTERDGDGISFVAGTIYALDEDVTFYAQWKKEYTVTTYTVTYDANGGTGAPKTENYSGVDEFTVSKDTPTLLGSTFLHWNTRHDGKGEDLEPGKTYKFADLTYDTVNNYVLYAVWEHTQVKDTPNLTLSKNNLNVNVGDKITFTVKANVAGNFKVSINNSIASFSPSDFNKVAANTEKTITVTGVKAGSSTITVDFEPTNSYSYETASKSIRITVNESVETTDSYYVVYDGNGGTATREYDLVEDGDSVKLPTATRSGYEFNGWYTLATGGTKVGGAGENYYPENHITLYAQWTKEPTTPATKTFKVTFDANGGTIDGNSVIACTTTSNSCDITDLPRAMKSGYTFDGWGTSKTCTNGIISTITVSKDETYYACYILNNVTDPDTGVDEDGNVTDNVQTGEVVMALVWFAGLFAIGYSIYYFKKIKQN